MEPQLSGLELAVAKISRVQGPQMILRQLRALIIRNHRAMVKRCESANEIEWAQRVHTLLTHLVEEGERVLPPRPLPRKIRHRARKGPARLF